MIAEWARLNSTRVLRDLQCAGLSSGFLWRRCGVGCGDGNADSMRCGKYLGTRDSSRGCGRLCGEPQRGLAGRFIEDNSAPQLWHDDPSACTDLPGTHRRLRTEVRRVIPVIKWEYKLGRGKFLKTLVFRGDILWGLSTGRVSSVHHQTPSPLWERLEWGGISSNTASTWRGSSLP